MGKAKAWKYNKDKVAKQQLHGVKDSAIKKNKEPKFKNTPTGKVALINNSKTQEIHKPSQKGSVKNHNQNVHQKQASKNNTKQASKSNTKQGSPNKKRSPPSKTQKLHKIKIPSNPRKTEKQFDGSDLDEEIISQEDDSLNKTNETFEEDSDMDVPDIFGKSLGDESDEDDEDFEEKEEDDDDSDEDMSEPKNIMFEGLISKTNLKMKNDKKDEEEEEDDEDNDDSDEDMSDFKNIMFKGLISKTNLKKNDKKDEEEEDDDDDDDDKDESDENTTLDESDEDDEDDTDEEDEDEDEEEDDDGKDRKQVKNIKNLRTVHSPMIGETSDDDDDDDDDDEDDEDNDDDVDTELGLKTLLGKSIADDDDDEDFNEEDEDEDEDDDISSEDEDDEEIDAATKADVIEGVSEINKLIKKLLSRRDGLDKKVVFLDNLPIETTEEEIRKLFGQFGSIKAVQLRVYPELIRSIRPPDLPVRETMIRLKKMYPDLTTIMGNILYTAEESALKAEKALHGKIFKGNYLSVQNAYDSQQIYKDTSKLVFFTHLKEGTEDNEIWKLFRKCSNLIYVRPMRNKHTGLNKGYGFVYLDSKDAVQSALQLDGTRIMGRSINVMPFNLYADKTIDELNKTDVKQGTKRVVSHKKNVEPSKKFKKWNTPILCDEDYEYFKNCEKERERRDKKKNKEKKCTSFQGQKVDLKNKKKKNKLDKKKKRMAEKLTAKSAKV